MRRIRRSGVAAVQQLNPPVEAFAGQLVVARVASFDEESKRIEIEIGGRARVSAALDATLDPIVVKTAAARGEPVIVERAGEVWTVLGALRTQPTPGIDAGDEYVIEARRVTLRGEHELRIVSGVASVIMRAQGVIETVAHNITSRAGGVQKIIGRMINMN